MTKNELIRQLIRDLNGAHDLIVRLAGEDPAKFDWAVWSSPANSIRVAEDMLNENLSKTNVRKAANDD